MNSILSGVSRVCPGSGFSTLDSGKPSNARVSAICPGCLGLYARARARVYKSYAPEKFLMREQKTLSTLDTLDKTLEPIVFKGFLVSRVVSRVGRFCLGLVFQGVTGD